MSENAPPPRLDELIPDLGFPGQGEMLDAFLSWTAASGLSLYEHQEAAIIEIFAGNHVVLDTPTGSGKSLVAIAMHFKTFAELGRTFYTAPIKALVSEKFFALCRIFGAEHVGMMTGDGSVNRDAPIICCTAEVLANLALREGEDARVDSVVMDEFHYYGDRDRGMAWQIPLLTLPQATFLLMSATLGDTRSIREDLEARTGRPVALVQGAHRPVPLDFEYRTTPLHETIDRLVRNGKAPIYVVHFTQRNATEHAQALMSTDYCTSEEKSALKQEVKGFRFASPFGRYVQRYVLHGVGVHHAGLLPRYRLLVEKLAQKGLLKVICGTDTLGVGINVPIRSVLFTQLCKYDGEKVDILEVRAFKQIAGRAGRAGYDERGFVFAQAPEHIIENMRLDAKMQEGKKKKVVKRKPPDRGYKHWDETTFQRLIESPPEPLESRFKVEHGLLLTLMQHADEVHKDAGIGVQKLLELVEEAHLPAARKQALSEQVMNVLEQLKAVGIAGALPEPGVLPEGRIALDPDLQHDFSLHHSLSLFLLDAISLLDRSSPDYTLDLVTLVESILENPLPVLVRQADKRKGEIINELKAQGVPYEERIEQLEGITWPKPRGEWIYETFNAYTKEHPWVSGEAIRPKSVVRDMYERYADFDDYVNDLGIQRSEGVLLRYLSDAYKALLQNVPAEERTDDLYEILGFLRAMLGRVDSSLVTEWEKLLAGADAATQEMARPVDISADPKAFKARIRAEMHALVRALARQDWQAASEHIRRNEDDPWGAEEIEKALAPFLEEQGELVFDHRARLAQNTLIREVAPHRWTVKQVLVGARDLEAEDEEDVSGWAIEGQIDLREDTNPDGPLVELIAIRE